MSEVVAGEGFYRVVGGCAVVRLIDGSERYVYKPAGFDASTVDAASIEHLVGAGLIEKVEVKTEPGDEGSIPEGEPSEEWTGKQLDAYAASKNIDVSKAKSKAEKVAAIMAAQGE
ncbi:hypothetical protein FYJ24_09390 [Actinomycetaceae bacterium WB03_NA08]|uniref:Uncharacterized protein n=1 Tax=Scrofimicrobium canadense TaxID=2652290 RepID=A0A6N7W965_9ACTO|nr:hypothetical protein [Scrofimicrobium canadense]MSS84972.1 hypothetical protein [Scrofimicrobium canadense]